MYWLTPHNSVVEAGAMKPATQDKVSPDILELEEVIAQQQKLLARVLELRQLREPLQKQLAAIDSELAQLAQELRRPLDLLPTPPINEESHRRRQHVKARALAALTTAGEKGMHLDDIVKATGIVRGDLDRFFYTRAAKELPGLIRLDKATFSYTPPAAEGAAGDKPAARVDVPAKPASVRRGNTPGRAKQRG